MSPNSDEQPPKRKSRSRLKLLALVVTILVLWVVAHKLLFYCGPDPFTPWPSDGPERFFGCVSKPHVSAYIGVGLFVVGAVVAVWGVWTARKAVKP